jgi:hypothetical protein
MDRSIDQIIPACRDTYAIFRATRKIDDYELSAKTYLVVHAWALVAHDGLGLLLVSNISELPFTYYDRARKKHNFDETSFDFFEYEQKTLAVTVDGEISTVSSQ